jgi:hypothetical protein
VKDLEQMSAVELLQTHGAVIDELRRRGVVKTRNNPIGDYTEWLVCQRLGLEMQANSKAAFDAVDVEGVRYQIKGRREQKTSVQFSSIRNLAERGFDHVIAVAFNFDYSIRFAVKIPHEHVRKFVKYQEHTNAHNLILTDKIADEPGVTDIRQEIDGDDHPEDLTGNDRQPGDQLATGVANRLSTSKNIGGIPKSISIRKNLIGRGVIREFEFNGFRYKVPHDELVRIFGEVMPKSLQSPSWTDGGSYSTSKPSKNLLDRLRPFCLNLGN